MHGDEVQKKTQESSIVSHRCSLHCRRWLQFRHVGFVLMVLTMAEAGPRPSSVVAVEPPRVTIQPSDDGLAIDAGSMGQFVLTYPAIYRRGEPSYMEAKAYKLIEKKPAGPLADLKYAGGAQARVEVQPDHTLHISFSGMPGDVQQFRMDMLIEFNYSRGGKYQIARAPEQPFPLEKPAKPHLYQGNADTLTLKNFDENSLAFHVPQYSFMELADNRAWNWNIFQWRFTVPYNPDQPTYEVHITPGAAASAGAKHLVDSFGQSPLAEYPDKLKSLADLQADVAAEQAYFAALTPPALDPYGGLPGSGAKLGLEKTGFFHVEKQGSHWYLVDPAGNAFFHLGVCAVCPSDDYTYTQGREGNYEWLPPFDAQFRTAFREQDRHIVSFHLANQIRKYGAPFDIDNYQSRMIGRLRKWGFNSTGAFSPGGNRAHREASFPYVAHLPLAPWEGFAELPGVAGAWDPFSQHNRQRMDKLFSEKLPAQADDPLLIGYFLVNEPLYENLPRALPALNGNFACKRRLVQVLQEKYATIERFNEAWNARARAFDELNDQGLAVTTPQATADVARFTRRFLELYFQLVADAFHKYDKHHLLLGNRFQPGTINDEALCRICGRYVDVVSFNYYTHYLDQELLRRIHGWTGDKPLILSEFYFASPKDSGLLGGARQVSSQQQRGQGYRHYVEQAASLDFIVGTEWFTLVDQSVTGRWFSRYNGECANTGLIAVSDRPWKAMLAEMIKTNHSIYDVVFGRRPPFVYDDPPFTRPEHATPGK